MEQPVRFSTAPTKSVAQTRLTARHGRNRLAIAIPWRHPLPALVWLGLLIGTVTVAVAYANASISATQTHFHLFWLGVLAFVVPAFLRLCAKDASRSERLAILAAVGLFNYLPKFLDSPLRPIYFDELGHWYQSEIVYHTGKLFQPNPIVAMAQFFPGLHALTVSIRDLSGLSMVQIATVLLGLLHILALLGVFMIAERALGSTQVAALAAFIYSLNPGFMFFDSQYAYESLAIVFFIWATVAVVNAQAPVGDPATRRAWIGIGLIVAFACIVTHHLSSFAMLGTLLLITAVTINRSRYGVDNGRDARWLAAFTVAVALGIIVWVLAIAVGIIEYLGPSITGGVRDIIHIAAHQLQSRTLFRNSTTPGYERLCAFMAPIVVFAGALCGLGLLRRRPQRLSAHLGLVLLGSMYFLSLPLMFTQSGNEGARRSWAFTYLGLALLIAPTIPWVLRQVSARRSPARGVALGGIAALCCVVLIGNVTANTNELYRFPGPYVYGSDTRSLTPELLQTTQWFRSTQGTGQSLIADRYTSPAFAAFSMESPAIPWVGFPVWELYFDTHFSDKSLLDTMRHSSTLHYMIIDRRMARYLPRLGIYFAHGEVGSGLRTQPPPIGALTKFETVPWAIKIYASDNLEVYRFNFAAFDAHWTRQHLPAPSVQRAQATPRKVSLDTREGLRDERLSQSKGRPIVTTCTATGGNNDHLAPSHICG